MCARFCWRVWACRDRRVRLESRAGYHSVTAWPYGTGVIARSAPRTRFRVGHGETHAPTVTSGMDRGHPSTHEPTVLRINHVHNSLCVLRNLRIGARRSRGWKMWVTTIPTSRSVFFWCVSPFCLAVRLVDNLCVYSAQRNKSNHSTSEEQVQPFNIRFILYRTQLTIQK